ncbi:hypothetical protein HAP47_0036575 [Bradyrhizobium sp. 41S5]|uniref:hypothetical protein n=1 Tax=Bradyrhizobium sp. 41S5 TaxID=1404443 RepID=UPI00156ADABD|nr:hypothetical protein [Bradyrhizobium sp. 41S5]UFX44447.1 hypothetical protein HAP47_0036575 [Bradyrhizobium sp. 41S5]
MDWPLASKVVSFVCFASTIVGLLPRQPMWMLWLFGTAGIQFADQMSGRDSASAQFFAASQLDTLTLAVSALLLAGLKGSLRWATFAVSFIITVYVRNEWTLPFFKYVDIATCLLAGVFWGVVFARFAWHRAPMLAVLGGVGGFSWGMATLALNAPEGALLYDLSGIGMDGGAVATFAAASLYNWFYDTPDELEQRRTSHASA